MPRRLLNFDRVHQPCLLPWRTSFLPPTTAGCWAGRSEVCRLRTTWRPLTFAGSTVFPSLHLPLSTVLVRFTEGTLPRRLQVPRVDVFTRPSNCLHTQRFGTLVGPPPPPWPPLFYSLLWSCAKLATFRASPILCPLLLLHPEFASPGGWERTCARDCNDLKI